MNPYRKTSDAGARTTLGDGERRLIACCLWLHVGFVGASALAIGLLQFFDGEAGAWALTLAVAGAVLAVASWRRGRAVVGGDERASYAGDASLVIGPEVTRLGRHARDCAELAAWPQVVGRTGPVGRR